MISIFVVMEFFVSAFDLSSDCERCRVSPAFVAIEFFVSALDLSSGCCGVVTVMGDATILVWLAAFL